MQQIIPCTRPRSRNPRRQPATALFSRLHYSPAQQPVKKRLRSCTLDTQIMHFGHMRCFLSALYYSFARVVFVLAFTFATSAAQIENKFKDKEELEQWLTAFGRHQVVGRAMYCLAKWTQRTWGMPADRWLWKVTLRPQQIEAPPNRRGATPQRPTTLQLCL